MRTFLPFLIGLLAVGAASAAKTGTVVSTIDAGSYTYVEINIEGKPTWYAATKLNLNKGDQVVAPDGMPMKNFRSETLDRTFDLVYFVDTIPLAGAANNAGALPAGHPPIQTTACPASTPAPAEIASIEKPEGGKTVAEIYQDSAALAGKPVVVRGKAVKVTNGIMGKNWVHLQDGTGDADSNDLTVTTTDTVTPNTIITVRGILATDLDFGSGYTYSVLLQDAAVETE
ncbi:hypothetical protein P4C99_03330 [Pontiellaceae bacterium B1224]|nr:hypothetical protein [Pontiellaceae bacterium B1224]